MRLPHCLLELPAEEAARLIALELIQALKFTRARLGTGDSEALHDLRVALRRLRTALRTYRPQLRDSLRRGPVRRLSRIARATRESRDLEVHLEWGRAQLSGLPPQERAGVEWLVERMARRRREAAGRLTQVVEREFDRAIAPLERRLLRYRAEIEPGPVRRSRAAAAVIGGRIERLAGELEAALGEVRTLRDEETAHRARITAKRLRYVLEPIAGLVAGVEPQVERLRALQDDLGDLHDSHVFVAELSRAIEDLALIRARRTADALRSWQWDPAAAQAGAVDPRAGLLALGRRLRVRGRSAFARVSSDWLAGAAGDFFHEVAELARRLAVPSPDREIERKYLLRELPPAAHEAPAVEIQQGYLPGTRLVERLRHVRRNGDSQWCRTVKSGTGVSRLELEEETSRELFERIWPLTAGRRVVKRRYRVRADELTWEIDEFLDRDLVLAEVELPAADTPVEPPAWLSPYVVREVTDEPEYTNLRLAR